ncbi:MAG: hypothetical protein JSU65_12730 [Candidatus Zixiibacteriota bacterium]|nr:MAG: hypothetical protein JSU65_12730 [candidate division Zixibacteria bacterium]
MKAISRMKLIGLVVAVAIAVFPSAVLAQDVANGSATATVQAALVVTAPGALTFGTVYQGVPVSIANNVASAGRFLITGQGLAGISCYMQCPDYMSTATGDDRMVIAFSTTDASIDSTGNTDPTSFGTGWQNVDPHNLPDPDVGGAGTTNIFLGGKVVPTVDQAAGAYTADIILTVAYNGS